MFKLYRQRGRAWAQMAIDPGGKSDFPKFKQSELTLNYLRLLLILYFRCKGPDN